MAAEIPEPGTPEFVRLSRSLDRRPLAYRVAKRAFDIVFSGAIVAVGLIPGAIMCLAIAVSTKGVPFYTQVRVGKYGRPFRLIKFRSMVVDADDVEKYLSPEQLRQWELERKVDDDPRITKIGRVIRKTSVDELPQFLNVLLGDMSVIGPRAITYEELPNFGDDVALALSVPQGITGLWQATSRNDATFESGERQKIELDYVRGAGFAMDLRCFLGTFGAMFGKRRSGR